MNIQGREKIIVLGMMGRWGVGGTVWMTLHYILGLQKLGYDVYYVEAHGALPWMFRDKESDAAAFIGSILRRFDMGDRWAFHARTGSGSYYGLSEHRLRRLYKSASAILNLHGGTIPTAEQSATNRLVYIDTDPTVVQVEIHHGVQTTLDTLSRHSAFFTFAENYGQADCKLPVSDRFHFKPTRQPVVLDFWSSPEVPAGIFTTVGNWKQFRHDVAYQNEDYYWSKHSAFLKFIDLPRHTTQPIELALSSCDEDERTLLLDHGWRVRDALSFSCDMEAYRQYVLHSRAEFTVAKEQYTRTRSGWFSERSATYLAAGRPVVTQETGFSRILPTGQGLFGFSTMEEAVSAIEAINSNYECHRKAAEEVARAYFSHDVVLTQLLTDLGMARRSPAAKNASGEIRMNLVADLSGHTGMSATADRYVQALESIGVSVNAIDSSQGLGFPSVADINLICCDVASHYPVRSRLGEDFFRGRYNIGVWLWESRNFPKEWCDRFAFYDEIWAPSSFIVSALSPISPVPIVRMPFVLEPGALGSRPEGRRRLGIRDEEFVFLFVFNFHSRVERKNPMAVIEAFKKSFGPDESAHLVIKCANAGFSPAHFEEMKRLADGYGITIHDGGWSAQDMSDLMAACDCYVSLHRAEGVGLTITDAMAAGKPVVATGWSGNMDFMNASNSFPVRYRLVELEQDVAHYRAGDVWAEPSIEHAAELLRYVFDHRDEAALRGAMARTDIQSEYSTAAIGALIARRLRVISEHGSFQSLKDSLENGIDDLESFLDRFSGLDEYLPEEQLRYTHLKKQLRPIVQTHVPNSATLLVVSKGDDELLRLDSCQARHFPAGSNDEYAGRHPTDSTEAINQLEEVRGKGGCFLLFPRTAFWWLGHYTEFRDHLLTRYKVAHRDESCVLFDLRPSA